MIKKKIFAVMVACLLTFVLAACGNTGNDMEESAVPESSTTVEPVVETESEPKSEESTSLANTSDEAMETEEETMTVSSSAESVTVSTSSEENEVSMMEIPESFVLIEGGAFQMGSPETESWRSDDETQHTVTVSDFYMSQYEVTQEEYEKVMGKWR